MKAKIFILLPILTIVAPSKGSAQNCGQVKDGAVVRLDIPGKSLEFARVQDQDGLATCYANVATLQLQAILPNHPELSYLHLAVNQAEEMEFKKLQAQGKNTAFKTDGKLLVDYGLVCEAVNLAKEKGGVCARKDVALEQIMFRPTLNQFSDPDKMQSIIFHTVSKYYDGILKDFKTAPALSSTSPQSKEKKTGGASTFTTVATDVINSVNPPFQNFFNKIISGVKKFVSEIVNSNVSKNDVKVKEASPEAIEIVNEITPEKKPDELQPKKDQAEAQELSEISALNKTEQFELYKKMLNKVINENKDRFVQKSCEKMDTTNSEKVLKNMMIRLYNTTNANKNQKFRYDEYYFFKDKLGIVDRFYINGMEVLEPRINGPVLKSLEDDYLKVLSSETKKPADAREVLKALLLKVNPKTPPALIEELLTEMSPEDREGLDQDYKRYALKDYSLCAPIAKFDYYKNKDGLIKDFKESGCPAQFLTHVKNLQEMVIGLNNINFNDIEKLNDFISNLPNQSYDKALMQLIAPSCTEDKKIPIPRNVNCSPKILSYPGSSDDNENFTKKHLATMKTNFAQEVLNGLNNNRPISASFCALFLKPASSNDFYLKNHQCGEKENFHAATLIGYKCEKGNLKYLMQNSWGAWDGANERFEKDSYGKAWINEEELVKNTYQLDRLD